MPTRRRQSFISASFISAVFCAVTALDFSVGSPLSTQAGGAVRMRRMTFLSRAPQLGGVYALASNSKSSIRLLSVKDNRDAWPGTSGIIYSSDKYNLSPQ